MKILISRHRRADLQVHRVWTIVSQRPACPIYTDNTQWEGIHRGSKYARYKLMK